VTVVVASFVGKQDRLVVGSFEGKLGVNNPQERKQTGVLSEQSHWDDIMHWEEGASFTRDSIQRSIKGNNEQTN